MRTEWGRDERTDWPGSKPVDHIALLILSVATGAGIECVRYLRDWTPLERHYLLTYVRTETAGTVRQNGRYTLLEVVTRKGSRLALDSEVVPMSSCISRVLVPVHSGYLPIGTSGPFPIWDKHLTL